MELASADITLPANHTGHISPELANRLHLGLKVWRTQ